MDGPSAIASERLVLVSLQPDFLERSIAGDREGAESLLGVTIPAEWFEEQTLMRFRLSMLRSEPEYLPWSLRAVISREEPVMVGHIGFHTGPDPEYLRWLAPGGIEFGYTIFHAFRRRGYAGEASRALMRWAAGTRGIRRFVLSISPDNIPSRRLAVHAGFRQIGSHLDEKDGPEDIYLLEWQAH